MFNNLWLFFVNYFILNIVGDYNMSNKKNTKTKDSKIKLNILVVVIGLLLITISFILNQGGIIRTVIWLLGTAIILFSIVKAYSPRFIYALIIFIGIFASSIVLDGIIAITLKKIPLFAYNITTSGATRVYNGIGIRVWQCDKENFHDLIIDPFYNKGYICETDSIPAIDVNSFLNSVIENYDDYKNSYIKIKGKISKKTGQNYLEMQPYETNSVTINGYVTFANNITLRILFNEAASILDNYDVYDEITIVGRIKNLENENNNYIIYMYDSKVASNIDLNEYTISVTEEKTCSDEPNIIYSNETMNVYTYCIDDMVITYPNDNKYELSVALSSNKITMDELFKNSLTSQKSEITNDTLYKFNEYSIIACDKTQSKDIFIGSKNMNFNNITCSPNEVLTE